MVATFPSDDFEGQTVEGGSKGGVTLVGLNTQKILVIVAFV